jgi:dTDP-4-amino-4,6-dideoxygalactose transaminase
LTVFSEPNSDYYSNHWLSAIVVDPKKTGNVTRENIRLELDKENIESRPLWKPMHLQPVFSGYPYYGGTISEGLFENGLCLPSGSNLNDADRHRIAETLKIEELSLKTVN